MSENRHIARAAGVVGVLTLASRIAGLARDVIIGYYFGTGVAADAFFVAFRIPNLLRRFVAEGATSVAFIPVFTDYLTHRGRDEAVMVARVLMTSLAVLLAMLCAAGVGLAPVWVRVFVPGFAAEPGKMLLTVRLAQMVFPYIALVGMVSVCGGLLNSLRHFATPALSPLVLNLAMIAAAVLVCPHLSTPIYGLAGGVLVGGLLQVLLQVVPLLRRGFVLRPLWRPRHPAVRRVLWLMAPTLFGAAVYQVNLMINTIFASMLPAGSVSFLWYATRVFEFPLGLFAVALGTAALPSFAAQAARGAHEEMRRSLAFAVRLTNFITLPATAGLVVLATPITVVLFRRGAFQMAQAEMTARALQAFALGLWSVSVGRLLVPACYALRDPRSPVVAGLIAFLANLAFILLLIGPVPGGPSTLQGAVSWLTRTLCLWDLGHAGLAAATSLSATVNLVVLAVVVSRRLGGLELRSLAASFGRSLVATAVMVPAVVFAAGRIEWATAPFGRAAAVLAVAIGIGLAVFAAVACLMGGPEVAVVAQTVRARVLGRDR